MANARKIWESDQYERQQIKICRNVMRNTETPTDPSWHSSPNKMAETKRTHKHTRSTLLGPRARRRVVGWKIPSNKNGTGQLAQSHRTNTAWKSNAGKLNDILYP
jgi:hypothetical protein